ncbi:helix-turn-helix transcriptional regulator [Streptacidiphilus melanogenes]|uniref:helix-turn-helix transcriptional regulator n=1 Tax=Streptacidiphilus melanogenes TaxID=411235 RepID=UPI0005A9E656|nr:response regulator transcription factor [Streptacidiphilus melanogenes]
MKSRISVSIYADDPITRVGLATELRQRCETELVDPPSSGRAQVVVLAPDALTTSALDLIRAVRSRDGAQAVLVLSAVSDEDLLAVVESGACSVLWRWEATGTALVQAVLRAAGGEAALPPDLLGRLLKQVGRLQQQVLRPAGLPLGGLSERERQVLRLAAEGLGTDEIAGELAYSKRTVTSVVHDITVRHQLRNRTHAVAYAIREGLI